MLLGLALFLIGCEPQSADPKSWTSKLGTASVASRELVLYVSHDRLFSDPILAGFPNETGLELKIVGDTEASKTTGLFQRIVRLQERPEADVFWNNEVMRTVQLAEMGLLERYVPASAAGLAAEYCDPQGRWVGFAARARVILYNQDLVPKDQAPASLRDLTQPRFRDQVAIANPLFGTTASHIAALFVLWGEKEGRRFLKQLRANGVRVVAGNALARNLVMNGEIAICLTDTDDANGAFLQSKPVEMVYPDQEGIGTLFIPNTVAVIRGGPNPEGARRLVEYLASAEVETQLVNSRSAQMALRPGIPPADPRFDPAQIRRMKVRWSDVAAMATASANAVREILLR